MPKNNNTQPNAGTSKRAQLAAQQAAEAAHKRTMRIVTVIGVIIALVIISVVAVVLVQNHQENKTQAQATGEQIVPIRANKAKDGIVYKDSTANSDAPLVDAYVDYQCPGCAQAAATVEPMLEQLADDGKIQLVYHTLYGLDRTFPGNHSYRAAIAATCVANLENEHFSTYSHTIFANQPSHEGEGYTDDQLLKDFAAQAGITGADQETLAACYTGQATKDFVKDIQDRLPNYVKYTPSFVVNEQVLEISSMLSSTDTLLQGINEAAGR